MNPFKSVGARLSFALVAVVALALGLVYMIVVPSLRQRLIDAKLNQLRSAMPAIADEVSRTEPFDFSTEAASGRVGPTRASSSTRTPGPRSTDAERRAGDVRRLEPEFLGRS